MKNDLLWAISLIVLAVNALALVISGLAGVTMPDILVRILGIGALAALAVFAYTTVKKTKKSK